MASQGLQSLLLHASRTITKWRGRDLSLSCQRPPMGVWCTLQSQRPPKTALTASWNLQGVFWILPPRTCSIHLQQNCLIFHLVNVWVSLSPENLRREHWLIICWLTLFMCQARLFVNYQILLCQVCTQHTIQLVFCATIDAQMCSLIIFEMLHMNRPSILFIIKC